MRPSATRVTVAEGTLAGGTANGLTVFGGIPFAAPPSGRGRFAPPEAVSPWQGVRWARRFSPAPPQVGPVAQSEDCLYLNVWSPDLAGRRPVLLFLHGGGYETGHAAPPAFPGGVLARALDCVVVAANYRLGGLGWLHLAERGQGWSRCTNAGLHDQLAALRWTATNVARFGGDPARITLGGSSAGAFSVGVMLSLAEVRAVVARAILVSGSTSRVFSRERGESLLRSYLDACGEVDCRALRALPVQHLLATQAATVSADLGARNSPHGRAWGAVIDGSLVREHPQAAVARGDVRGIPLLVGTNAEEGFTFMVSSRTTFAPVDRRSLLAEMEEYGIDDPTAELHRLQRRLQARGRGTTPAELRAEFLGEAVYTGPCDDLADAHAVAGGQVHRYVFADAPLGPELGAGHGVDDLYLLDKLSERGVASPQTRRVQQQLWSLWRDFVHERDLDLPVHAPGARAHGVIGSLARAG